jgi:hypothetical protein
MRWRINDFDPFQWHQWFAWYPVRIGYRRVWLEKIERQMAQDMAGHWWEYR